jgi:Fur family peroxide stress response transcriptional regulator
MNKADQNRKMREFQEKCRELGLSVTYQRLSIYRALLQIGTHASPDEVFQLVRRAYPSLSLATVYKTLERLERAGLIAKPNLLHDTALYEHRVGHHHHVVCTACKRLTDLDPDDIDAALPRAPRDLGVREAVAREFDLQDYSITFRGVCRACRKAAPKAPAAVPVESAAAAPTA